MENSPYNASGEKTSSDNVPHYNPESFSKEQVLTLGCAHPGLSQITAGSLSPDEGIFITFMISF